MSQRRTTLRDELRQPIIARQRDSGPTGNRRERGSATIARVLAPGAIGRKHATVIEVGDSVQTTLEVQSFAPMLDLTWLNDADLGVHLPGVSMQQHISRIAAAEARRILVASEKAGMSTIANDAQRSGVADDASTLGIAAVAALRSAIAADTDALMQYRVTITISSATREQLAERVDAIRRGASLRGCILTPTQYRMYEAYAESLPLGHQLLTRWHDAAASAVAMGLPTATPGLSRKPGALPVIYGEHPATGAPILYDRKRAVNPHGLVVGEPGNGKTYVVSGLLAQDLALGQDAILLLDPKQQEYLGFVRNLDGAYISLTRMAGYHINPLELPRLTIERAQQIVQDGIDLLGERIAFVGALIENELRESDMSVLPQDRAAIDRAVLAAYRARGVTDDVMSFNVPMPTFSDVQAALARDGRADLAESLQIFTEGSVGDLFNAPSNIPTDNPLLAIDLSVLLRTPDRRLARVIPVIVLDFFVTTAINRPTGRPWSHLVLDEGHVLLATPAGRATLALAYRIGRSLKFQVTLITQSWDDLFGMTDTTIIVESARTKLLLGVNAQSGAAEKVGKIMELNEAELAYLKTCGLRKGQGSTALLVADTERTPVFIRMWPEALHRLVTGRTYADEAKR